VSFREIDNEIDDFYNTADDGDLVEKFYIPALSQSVKYDRLSGFFNSDSLAIAARGISELIKNNGHMRLLCGALLSEEDLLAIEHADDLKDIVNKNFLDEYENLEDQFVKDHVLLLGWMIANDFLEIKIGINTDGEHYYPEGMLHSKRGILYDENDDCILFMGSVNETKYGWTINVEDLRVDKSWINYKPMKKPIKNFEELWEGNYDSLLIFDLPEDSKKILVKSAPKNKEQLKEIIKRIEDSRKKHKDGRELFPHQKDAIKSWLDNDKMGIFEMATGTGKTFTALKCLEEATKKENLLVVIACPYAHIIDQWEKDIINLGLGNIYRFGGGGSDWRKEFHKLKFNINLPVKYDKPNIILTTHNTFSNKDFIDNVNGCNIKSLLIVDEMHHVGAEGFSKGLYAKYDYKLGLSATPSKFMDYEGTENLINAFGKIVYKFTIVDALNRINFETGKSFLTPYDYYPIRVDLNEYELEEYKKLNKIIAQKLNKSEKITFNESLSGLFAKRRGIVNNADAKYDELHKILKGLSHDNHIIIFCSDKQVKKVLNILDEEGISPKHKFTQHEGGKPSKKFGGISQKQDLLRDFDSGKCKALVAIKCLDEGVDVPSADQVIIMSSTTNPAEYIQRRGRVLRRYEGKEKAYIYDLCVIPNVYGDSFKMIYENERKRLLEFIKTASKDNRKYCMKLIEQWGLL